MALGYEDTASDSDTSVANVTLTPAAAPAENEIIYIAYNFIADSAGSFPTSYSVTGFTEVTKVSDGSQFGELVLFRKVAGESEPTSYTVTVTGGSFYSRAAGLIVLSGGNTADPDGTPVSGTDDTGDETWNIGALTTDNANSWDLVIVGSKGDSFAGGTEDDPFLSSWGSSLIERVDTHFDASV